MVAMLDCIVVTLDCMAAFNRFYSNITKFYVIDAISIVYNSDNRLYVNGTRM